MSNSEGIQSETEEKRLVSVRIEGLFGNLTHSIQLNSESGITILTGPNGCGKTTILKLIDAFAHIDLRVLLDVPFRRILFGFDNETEISVTRIEDEKDFIHRNPAKPLAHKGGLGFHVSIYVDKKPPREKIFKNKCQLQFVMRNNERSAKLKSYTTGIFDPDIKPYESVLLAETKKIPRWLRAIGVHTEFISTERIEQERTIKYLDKIKEKSSLVSEEVAIEKIGEAFLKQVSKTRNVKCSLAKKLARSRNLRIIDCAKMEANYSSDDLNARLQKITDKQKRLNKVGILEGDLLTDEKMAGAAMAELSIYVEDEEQQLGIFDELLCQAELFQHIVNSKLVNKKAVLNAADGFKVISSHNGESIPLHLLSSGEQHEINLFFNLIFRIPSNSLVLIDEPELSLHVAWQTDFISDVERVSKIVARTYIVATHSPSIVNNHWNLVVELGGDEK